MDDARAPTALAADACAARLPYRGGPGPVMTAAGQTRKPRNLRHPRAGRERAACES